MVRLERTNMKKLIVLMAPPCVGKTLIANQIKETHKNCKIISKTDVLKYHPDEHINSTTIRELYYFKINEAFSYYDIVIADDTQTTIEARQELFNHIKNLNDIEIIGIWIEIPLQSALSYNKTRSSDEYLDPYIIKEIYRYAVSPRQNEPFKNVIFISRENCIGLQTNKPRIQSISELIKDI